MAGQCTGRAIHWPRMALDWDSANTKAREFVAQLTLAESFGCELVSVFPAGVTVASNWDRNLMYERGRALGAEFRAKGAHNILGCAWTHENDLWSLANNKLVHRWEPWVDTHSEAATGKASGLQSNGLQTCAKYFLANEQETQRSNTTIGKGTQINAISSNVDDRTLHELYMWPFYDAVGVGTAAIMCSYQRLNQTYSCENQALLDNLLKGELGFRGYVISDWFATHSTYPYFFGRRLHEVVGNGTVSLDRLDDMIIRIMTAYYLLGQDDPEYPTLDPSVQSLLAVTAYGLGPAKQLLQQYGLPWTEPAPRDVRADHASLIRKLGTAGAVHLKNTNSTLPLGQISRICVFGSGAADLINGAMYPDLTTCRRLMQSTPKHAIRAPPTPGVCIVFLTAFASESYDRTRFEADGNSTCVVQNVADLCNNTVVVLHAPGVVTMPWVDHPNVTTIIAAHYPGQEIGNSIVDIIWGAEEPSGRFPYTIPMPNFAEGQLIDYRVFDAHDITPRYEFGFGLSYTTFEMSNLSVQAFVSKPSPIPDRTLPTQPGGNPDLCTELLLVETEVRNTGSVGGNAVPQLYMSFPGTVPEGTPLRQLRGFDKLYLAPGASAKVLFRLKRRDLSYWNTATQNWVIPEGAFILRAGFSSRDLKSEIKIDVLNS
ncbi:hypothetical protein BBP40_005459 [Aspergillus hancockii]|nr:hypothetical protein BBP40_005459 [Aspergillus hancockii]